MTRNAAMNRILRPVSYMLAAIYFLVDFVFAGVARPISNWVARHFKMRWLRDWIRSLSPYPCLILFSVPLIVLEPIKFVAAYLAATGYVLYAITTLIVGELLKLVMIERLFELTRKKLMKIPAFAFAYGYYSRVRTWIMQTEAAQIIRSAARSIAECVGHWRHEWDRRLGWETGPNWDQD